MTMHWGWGGGGNCFFAAWGIFGSLCFILSISMAQEGGMRGNMVRIQWATYCF